MVTNVKFITSPTRLLAAMATSKTCPDTAFLCFFLCASWIDVYVFATSLLGTSYNFLLQAYASSCKYGTRRSR